MAFDSLQKAVIEGDEDEAAAPRAAAPRRGQGGRRHPRQRPHRGDGQRRRPVQRRRPLHPRDADLRRGHAGGPAPCSSRCSSTARAGGKGTVVMGAVKGDLHDIGKNLVVLMLEGAGFTVVDLGTDVAPEDFVAAAKEHDAAVVGMSALLVTTMPQMKITVEPAARGRSRRQGDRRRRARSRRPTPTRSRPTATPRTRPAPWSSARGMVA